MIDILGSSEPVGELVGVGEQNFNQEPANHMSASCEPAFANFLEAKTQNSNKYLMQQK